MNVVGLFSGIGGLELPFHQRGAKSQLLCDIWAESQKVLKKHFHDVEIHGDIKSLNSLPADVDVVTAGFPCTDLSQAGKTAGINGQESGLVSHVFRLLEQKNIEWLVLENVRNMLVLDSGRAMAYLTSQLESLGFRWAYRLVDSQCSGVPHRRHRVLFVASRHNDPRTVLFADDAGKPEVNSFRGDSFGFYWTEGLRGLGWAQDAVPPLKGGSSVGIPSPPAIWLPGARPGYKLATPSIEAAESLQGFERGWTSVAQNGKANGPRWKLVGNAVTVNMARWLVDRIYIPGDVICEGNPIIIDKKWPNSAYGANGKVWEYHASTWPIRSKYVHLTDLLHTSDFKPLSLRAMSGFYERSQRSSLRFDPKFLQDVRQHIEVLSSITTPPNISAAVNS